jgi:glutathione synthase/RimK-type ligase-like ATP-grasp enzyme
VTGLSWRRSQRLISGLAGGRPLGVKASANVLLCWEAAEVNSWNPILVAHLRSGGMSVTEAHNLDDIRALDLSQFDICLPRFRVGAADMSGLDQMLVRSGVPMLNSLDSRRQCENKALAHLAFEERGIPQPISFVMSSEGARDRSLRWTGETLIKPLYGNRSSGIEILPSYREAVDRAIQRREDLLIQQLIWPARCWRVVVGRHCGVVDPYWRRPPRSADRVLSISTGSSIARTPLPARVERVAIDMLEAVGGDLLATDVLETETDAYALEINHNFDAHGGDGPAVAAFRSEIEVRPLSGRAASLTSL